MHRIIVVLGALTAGCAWQNIDEHFECSSYIFDGSDSFGAIKTTADSAALFLEQLPEAERDWPYCWLWNADGRVELTVTDVSHFFVHDGEPWKHEGREEYIIIWHERR